MEKISTLIPRILSKRGLKEEANASYAVHLSIDWLHQQSIGFAEQCIVTTMVNGTLTVECLNSIVMQELHQRSEELKEYLNGIEGISVARISIIRSTKC